MSSAWTTSPSSAAPPALIVPGDPASDVSFDAFDALCRELERALLVGGARGLAQPAGVVEPISRARLALVAAPTPSTLLVAHAAGSAGFDVVLLHPRLVEAERAAQRARARVDLSFEVSDVEALVADARAALARSRTRSAEDVASLLGDRSTRSGELLLFTSGTSGASKAARLSRRALAAGAVASLARLPMAPSERWLCTMPLAHVGGLALVTRCWLARRTAAIAPRFEPEAVVEFVASAPPGVTTRLSVVPTMLASLLGLPRFGELRNRATLVVGGAACPPELLDACARARVLAVTTYGLTESASMLTLQPARNPALREPGSGLPLPRAELRVREDGHVLARGPMMFEGYLDEPSSLDADGFFDTGDLGALDDEQRLHVLARRTNLIVTGGENVYPAEVEAELAALRGVGELAVFGLPDPRWGQVVACAVVPAASDGGDQREALARELVALAASRLAPHKRPRRLAFAAALPRTPTGKLARAELAPRFADAATLVYPSPR